MLKINLKKFLSLFLVIVLVTAQVFTVFAHDADAESSEQNVNPQVNEEVFDDAHESEEIFESTEESKEAKEEETEAEGEGSDVARSAAEETETEFVGEELDEEVDEETEEVEEPENPDDLIEKEEITEETNDETQTVNTETEETEADIEVEIVDGEIVEKETTEAETTEAETTEAETTEEELETLEEIAETVETKLAQGTEAPDIYWSGFPNPVCDEIVTISVDPIDDELVSVTFNGVDKPISGDPTQVVTFSLTPDPDAEIEIIATNLNGQSSTMQFPKKLPHDFYYVNSDPEDEYTTRTVTALCHNCGTNCGQAEFTTTEGISEVWDEAGITPFADPDYTNWQPEPLVVEYTNNFKAGKADDSDITKRPTCTLTDSTGAETFAIAYFTITKNTVPMNPPTGVTGVETSTIGSKDGKLEGLVPYEMEWSFYEDQLYQTVTTDVIENLAPRIYYVRFKDTDSHGPSDAAEIEVPRGTTPDPKPPSPGGGGSGSGGGGGGGGASRGGAMPSFINIIPYAPIGADPAAGKYSLFYDAVVGAYKATPTVNTIARSPEDSAKPLETGAIDTTKESNQAEGFASGWALVQDVAGQSDNWYYFDPATKFMKTGWVQDNGYLYFTHNKDDSLRGRIYSGWHDVDGQVCYFDETNYCLTAVISKVDALTRGIVTVEDSAAAVTLGNLDLKPTVGSQGLATITFADQTSIRPGEQNANNAPTLLTVTSSTDLAESRKEFLDSLAALGMIQQ